MFMFALAYPPLLFVSVSSFTMTAFMAWAYEVIGGGDSG